MRRIYTAVAEPGHRLRLTDEDGNVVVVDFTPRIARGGIFATLRDPVFFAQVTIGERGRYIHWPGDLDFCADALWLEGQAQSTVAHTGRAAG